VVEYYVASDKNHENAWGLVCCPQDIIIRDTQDLRER
jgi:hypothetical protein